MAAYIYIDPASGATTSKWTYSVWCKRTGLNGLPQSLLTSTGGTSTTYTEITFNADDTLTFYNSDGGSADGQLKTSAKYRDIGAWMHVVCIYDSANGTTTDKMKMYVNGVEPDFQTDDAPSGNTTIGNTYPHFIGAYDSNADRTANTQYFLGDMSHSQMYNNAVYAVTDFGSFDATSGIWKIKTSGPSATYGTNGWFLKMEDRTNLDLDSSDNAYTFSTSGTLTATYDNPSNNFCTLNPLWTDTGYWSGDTGTPDISDGNLQGGKATHCNYLSTMATDTMKCYWEVYVNDTNQSFGIVGVRPTGGVTQGYADTTYNGVYPYSSKIRTNGSEGDGGPASTADSYYMFALDPVNNKMWYGREGTWVGDPAAGTGATWTTLPEVEFTPTAHPMATTQENNSYFNFGNGYFGGTSSGTTEADDAGIGQFKYNVPTGFYALCTKNIKAYGG